MFEKQTVQKADAPLPQQLSAQQNIIISVLIQKNRHYGCIFIEYDITKDVVTEESKSNFKKERASNNYSAKCRWSRKGKKITKSDKDLKERIKDLKIRIKDRKDKIFKLRYDKDKIK